MVISRIARAIGSTEDFVLRRLCRPRGTSDVLVMEELRYVMYCFQAKGGGFAGWRFDEELRATSGVK